MKKPLFILIVLIASIVLLIGIGLPLWAEHEVKVSAVPKDGTYVCEELSMSITFGDGTIVALPDGSIVDVHIDHGRHLMQLSEDSAGIEGWYKAHLKDGYFEITFEFLPIPFEPDYAYRFVKG